jgi:DNA-binding response OmpR family regulator
LDPRNPDYIVKIIDPNKEATVFGFAILNSQQTELVPCQGRRQSSQPYVVELLFRRKTPVLYNVLKLTGLLLFAASLLFLKKPWKTKTLAEHPPTPSLKETEELDWINLGGFRLHWGNNTLQLQDQVIELTNKEMQLLKMFALEPNTVIDRSRLLKEVWQDEGVMVSRSLDMFISKLRKKLEGDANVQLRNVHGKGYGIFLKELK